MLKNSALSEGFWKMTRYISCCGTFQWLVRLSGNVTLMTRLFWLDVWPCFGGKMTFKNPTTGFGQSHGRCRTERKNGSKLWFISWNVPNPVYIALVGCLEPRRCEGIGRSRSHTWWGTHLGFDVFLFFFVSRFCFTACEASTTPFCSTTSSVFFQNCEEFH